MLFYFIYLYLFFFFFFFNDTATTEIYTLSLHDALPIIGDVRSAALYFSNWHFAAQATDYFAATNAPSPVIHFWSLSAEEQFYLVWPALVMIVLALCRAKPRRGRLWLGALAVALASMSLASLAVATRHGSERAYY